MSNEYQEALDRISYNFGECEIGSNYYDRQLPKDLKVLQQVVDKEKPMKPSMIWEHANPKTRCKCSAGVIPANNYCWNCGQKLDWSNKEELEDE